MRQRRLRRVGQRVRWRDVRQGRNAACGWAEVHGGSVGRAVKVRSKGMGGGGDLFNGASGR